MSLHDRVLDESKRPYFRRVGDGEYRGTILGVPVLVQRFRLGWHKWYNSYSKQPHWIAYHAVEGGQVLSDGNSTMKGAIENAEHAIRMRGLDKKHAVPKAPPLLPPPAEAGTSLGESDSALQTAVLAVLGEKSYVGGHRIVDAAYVAKKARISAAQAKRVLDKLVAEKVVKKIKHLRRVAGKWGEKDLTKHVSVDKYQLAEDTGLTESAQMATVKLPKHPLAGQQVEIVRRDPFKRFVIVRILKTGKGYKKGDELSLNPNAIG